MTADKRQALIMQMCKSYKLYSLHKDEPVAQKHWKQATVCRDELIKLKMTPQTLENMRAMSM